MINESLSLHGTIQKLNVHHSTHSKEDFLIATSMNERSLIMFEYTQITNDQIDSSNNIIVC